MLSPITQSDLIAALRLQEEWGVDALVDDVSWQPMAPSPRRLEKASSPSPGAPHTPPLKRHDLAQTLLASKTLDELIRKSDQLDTIALARTAMHRLNPVYVEQAPFVLVGEVPDTDEDRSGSLFAGQAGILLDKILASIGLSRKRLSLVPAIPWRPPGGRKVALRELETCRPILQRSLTLGHPKRIVTMGQTPVHLLLGRDVRLDRVRGKWVEVSLPDMAQSIPLLPLYHPLKLVGGETTRRHFWQDLLLLAETLDQDSVSRS